MVFQSVLILRKTETNSRPPSIMNHPVSASPRVCDLWKKLLPAISLLKIWVSPASGMGVILPMYGNTTSQFAAAEAAARRVPLIAVFNPDNGPGGSKRASYATMVNRIKAAGGQVVGYISTDYTNVDIGDVQSQMNSYSSWYGVNGYFLDEMHYTSSKLAYYKSANTYAKGKGKFIVGNPGSGISSTYLQAAQILITFENPVGSGWGGASGGGDSSRYGAIPYSAGNLGSLVSQGASKNYGWIYVTNHGEPDPFGNLPSYWEQELQAVEALNAPPLPAALPADKFFVSQLTPLPGGGVSITFPAVGRRRYGIQVSPDLTSWKQALTPDTVPVVSEITPAQDGPVTLRAGWPSGAGPAFYRAVDLNTLEGR